MAKSKKIIIPKAVAELTVADLAKYLNRQITVTVNGIYYHPDLMLKDLVELGKQAIAAAKPDMVEITCYGKTETTDRKKAIAFYKDCAANSEGCERERYQNILDGLEAGENKVSDQERY